LRNVKSLMQRQICAITSPQQRLSSLQRLQDLALGLDFVYRQVRCGVLALAGAALACEPFGDVVVVFGVVLAGAMAAEVMIAACEGDDGLTGRLLRMVRPCAERMVGQGAAPIR
jgi:hypothetical protein